MFIDRAVVRVVGGTGGSGASSFARFKYRPKGGPDGGDGGHGGSVFVRADPNLATLLDYRYRTEWKAERAEHGKGKTKTGASTDGPLSPRSAGHHRPRSRKPASASERCSSLAIRCAWRGAAAVDGATPASPRPPTRRRASGSRAKREKTAASSWCSSSSPTSASWASPTPARARSSRSSRRRGPRSPTIRSPRSSPTSASSACPMHRTFVMADIPGIIEGAHEGKGLGLRFLQHVERTRVLAFLVSLDSPDPQAVYERLRAEVRLYSERARRQGARRAAHQARPPARRRAAARASRRPRRPDRSPSRARRAPALEELKECLWTVRGAGQGIGARPRAADRCAHDAGLLGVHGRRVDGRSTRSPIWRSPRSPAWAPPGSDTLLDTSIPHSAPIRRRSSFYAPYPVVPTPSSPR